MPANSDSLLISMIGSGNVATHLSLAFEQAGHQIQTVYSRHKNNAVVLIEKLKKATAIDNLNFNQQPQADIYFICVSDAAVSELMQQAIFPGNSLVVHTAGSLPLSVLGINNKIHAGVFYPIQTFSKNQLLNFKEVPIAIEAAHPDTASLLLKLAATISGRVVSLSSQNRKQIHLAAVFACNFTNHLLGISQEILHNYNLPDNLLKPLIKTTVEKALQNNPFAVQTGPAVRGDLNILQQQTQALSANTIYQEIYQLLSKSIQIKTAESANLTSINNIPLSKPDITTDK